MTDLLSPDEVREMAFLVDDIGHTTLQRLCRDYLTLWKEVKELKTKTEHLKAWLRDVGEMRD